MIVDRMIYFIIIFFSLPLIVFIFTHTHTCKCIFNYNSVKSLLFSFLQLPNEQEQTYCQINHVVYSLLNHVFQNFHSGYDEKKKSFYSPKEEAKYRKRERKTKIMVKSNGSNIVEHYRFGSLER